MRQPTADSCGAQLIVNGRAALSSMLVDATDLDDSQEPFAAWYDKHAATLSALDPLGA